MKLVTPIAAMFLAACAAAPDYLPEESIPGIDGAVPIVRCQRTRARFPRSAFNRYQAFHATATIRLEVMSDGSIGQVAITKSTSDDDLDAAALRAARAMKCKPVGEGTTVTALVTFTFDLR